MAIVRLKKFIEDVKSGKADIVSDTATYATSAGKSGTAQVAVLATSAGKAGSAAQAGTAMYATSAGGGAVSGTAGTQAS
jgi:hypothetical protein